MSTAQARDYRKKSDAYARIAGKTRSPEDGSGYRKIAQAYRALAEIAGRRDGETDMKSGLKSGLAGQR